MEAGTVTPTSQVAPPPRLREKYENEVLPAKLPDEIATPGEPPPTDNVAPGGGSGGTTIE